MEIWIRTNEWKAPETPVIPSGTAPASLSLHALLLLSTGRPLRSLKDDMLASLQSLPWPPTLLIPNQALGYPSLPPRSPHVPQMCYRSHSFVIARSVPTSDQGRLVVGLPLISVSGSLAPEWIKVGWMGTWAEHWQGHWATLSVFILHSFIHLLIYSLMEWPQIHQGKRESICILLVKNKLAFATPLPWYKPQAHRVLALCYLNCTPIKTFWEADEVMEERSQSEQNLFLH